MGCCSAMRNSVTVIVGILGCLATFDSLLAQTTSAEGVDDPPAIFDRRATIPETARVQMATGAQTLLDRAHAQGSLQVIVTLRVGEASSLGDLRSTVVPEWDEVAIRSAQTALLKDIGASPSGDGQGLSKGVQVLKLSRSFPWLTLNVSAQGIEKLLRNPNVVRIRESTADSQPQLASSVPWINADDVWNSWKFVGTGQTIAIIDTGVDGTHPMLSGKIVAEACFSTKDTAKGGTPVCPGGVLSSTAVTSGRPCDRTINGCDHGTHVASIAAGKEAKITVGKTKITLSSGVAPGAQLIAIQTATRRSKGKCGQLTTPCATIYYHNTIEALEHVYKLSSSLKITAVNMSLGGDKFFGGGPSCDYDQWERKAVIDQLLRKGIAVIASTGNNSKIGSILAPACITGVVAVGNSTDPGDTVWRTSNHSARVDLLAPGTAIEAAVPVGGESDACKTTGTTISCVMTGTSMASPHVAGAWALLKQAKPTASNDAILEALRCTGKAVSAGGIPKPRIDVLAALDVLSGRKSCGFDITVFDDGTAKDDVFVASVDGKEICETPTGGLRKCSISGITPGTHKLTIFVRIAPDNLGTYSVILGNGLTFADGSTRTPPERIPHLATKSYDLVVPKRGGSPALVDREMGPSIDYTAAYQPG